MTWRSGVMPSSYENTSGEASFWPEMDAQGTCYQGYHFRHGGSPSSGETELQYVFFRLTPDEDTLQTLQVTDGAWGGTGVILPGEDDGPRPGKGALMRR